MRASAPATLELELELPAAVASIGEARRAMTEIARKVGGPDQDVKLAVSEAVGNAVVHAYRDREGGTISLQAHTARGKLVITVSDDGMGMTPNLDSPGLGLGVTLMSKLAEDVRFDSSSAGTTVAMSFPIEGSGTA